ncbi:MAG: hypothetical protein QMD53_05925 [Actinomycetota bacterium]|nr:hypothetical protein [Actinomycetota bacterium]
MALVDKFLFPAADEVGVNIVGSRDLCGRALTGDGFERDLELKLS